MKIEFENDGKKKHQNWTATITESNYCQHGEWFEFHIEGYGRDKDEAEKSVLKARDKLINMIINKNDRSSAYSD